jgi:hypothetical protein
MGAVDDLILLGIALAFFALTAWLVRFCYRLSQEGR